MIQLAPSILSADFSRLGDSVAAIERAGAHLIHVDVMDGHFVPNISFGAAVMKSLLGKSGLPFDVHLMIEEPDRYLEDFVTEQTEYITVHQEACVHLNRTIQHIKSLGVKAGVSDICLPYPKGIYCGLYIEMKFGSNRKTAEQKEFLQEMEKVGHFVATCYSAEDAVKVIEEYLNIGKWVLDDGKTIHMTIPNNSTIKDGVIKDKEGWTWEQGSGSKT